jgi:hypothetical protein
MSEDTSKQFLWSQPNFKDAEEESKYIKQVAYKIQIN